MNKGFIFAGGLWLTVVAIIMVLIGVSEESGRPGIFLDDGVVIFSVLIVSLWVMLLLGVKLYKSHPKLGRSFVQVCFIILVLYTTLAIFSVGIFILPAIFLLYFGLSTNSSEKLGRM
jgi:membrane-associated HD superfamily phosphohydrolase